MRVLIDAQLPPGLCVWFRERGVEADPVSDVLGGQTEGTPEAVAADAASVTGFYLKPLLARQAAAVVEEAPGKARRKRVAVV